MLSLQISGQAVKSSPVFFPASAPSARRPKRRRLPTLLPLSCPRCEGMAYAYGSRQGKTLQVHSECNACGLRYSRVRCTGAQYACRLLWAMTQPLLGACAVVCAYFWLMWAF